MRVKMTLICFFTAILVFIFNFSTQAEKSFSEISYTYLDDDVIEIIHQEVELPGDYDISRAMKGMDYLVIVEDFSIPGAAGLIGNAYAESRLLINAGKGFYKGLFQWDGKCRWPKVKKYLESHNVIFDNQEELYLWELVAAVHSEDAENYQEVIDFCKQSGSARESADKWCKKFEGTKQALSTRKRVAELTADAYRIYIKTNRFKSNGIPLLFLYFLYYNEFGNNKKMQLLKL